MKLTFENLTAEGYAAFILAIIFTIFAIAGFIVFAKHKDLSKVVTIVITLLFPFLAVFCWVYLILNVIKYDAVMSLAISVGAAAGYVLLALCFALILNAYLKNRSPRQPKEKKQPVAEEEKVEQTFAPATETKEEETETTITTVQPEGPKQPELITMQENLRLNHNPIKSLPEATVVNTEETQPEGNEVETQNGDNENEAPNGDSETENPEDGTQE